jgi:hypothetical protein
MNTNIKEEDVFLWLKKNKPSVYYLWVSQNSLANNMEI